MTYYHCIILFDILRKYNKIILYYLFVFVSLFVPSSSVSGRLLEVTNSQIFCAFSWPPESLIECAVTSYSSPKNVAIRKSVSTATFRFVALCFRTTLAPFCNDYTRVKKSVQRVGRERSCLWFSRVFDSFCVWKFKNIVTIIVIEKNGPKLKQTTIIYCVYNTI